MKGLLVVWLVAALPMTGCIASPPEQNPAQPRSVNAAKRFGSVGGIRGESQRRHGLRRGKVQGDR